MKFKTWIPRDQDRFQPTILRLYFSQTDWVGFKRAKRPPASGYEAHRAAKGEIQFSDAIFQFGGFDEKKAREIVEVLRLQRLTRLQELHPTLSLDDISFDEALEFAKSETGSVGAKN